MRVEQVQVVIDNVGSIEKDLIESETLNLVVPRIRADKAVQALRHGPERRQVFPADQHQVRAQLLGLRDGHELLDPASPRLVVTCGQETFLLDPQRQPFQSRLLVFDNCAVEVIIVLASRSEGAI
jgi:hypothetical protein